ncbi:MAG TPA: hypothetical protein VF284_01445, partial [Rhodanobacteraceae bacterium]
DRLRDYGIAHGAISRSAIGHPWPATSQSCALHGHDGLSTRKRRPGRPPSKWSFLQRRCMTPRRAAEWQSKRRMFEHRDVRVRRGCHSASTKGRCADTTSAHPSCQAQWFW